jgi:Fe-S-cluster containining protein
VTSYEQLIVQTDALTTRLAARYAVHLACRAGCSGCCQHHLSVFLVEAAHLAAALAELPVEARTRIEQQAVEVNQREARGEPVACPMLVDDRCAIYAARPLICRTQGLPLLFEAEDGAPEVDFCPLNFTTPEAVAELDEQHLVPLDQLNTQLALVNLQHCRTHGIPAELSGQRRSLSDIIQETSSEI